MFQSIISHSGRQHAEFGAKPFHFAAFGDALIWGLEQQFGAAFSPEMKEAWIKLYDDVQREMMRAGLPGKEGRLEAPNPVGRCIAPHPWHTRLVPMFARMRHRSTAPA